MIALSIPRPAAVALALAAALALAPAATASAATPLRTFDSRARDSGPVTSGARRARAELERRLGDEGVVTTDRVSGAARLVARTDGALTGRSTRDPADVALDYVRTQTAVFGLDGNDLGALRRTSRYRSADGVTHLAYLQTDRGIAAYDNVLVANVDRRGRLLNVGGAAVSALRAGSITPRLGAAAALAAAKQEVGAPLVAPRARRGGGPERPTTFSNGDTARLVLFGDGATTRLAWRLQVTGAHGVLYELVLDATNGKLLKRRSLTEFAAAHVYRNFPGAASGGTPALVDLAADPSWLSQSADNAKLSGNNAHAYADADTVDVDADGLNGPTAYDAEVGPSAGSDWDYPMVPFTVSGQTCAAPGCTWNANTTSTRTTNRNQATTQLFYLVNAFHDHLRDPPIGFTHAARNFELVDSDGAGPGVGGDPVMAEADNYDNPDPPAAATSTNNANMTTPLDGSAPRLQMFLFTNPSLNSADTADVVYHEYAHGLTNRSVGSGVGLDAAQSRAMGEAWSDWYALDFLEAQGLRPDTGANGEMTIGAYLVAGGFRNQGADCPVGAPAPACPGRGPGNRGGYTLGDLGSVESSGFEVHSDGEIWLETLWDLRQQLGAATAQRLVTSALRLSPNNPSMLEERDAILLADQTAGGANYETLWSVFAARGMGFGAATTSSAATTATEAFDLPPRLVHESTTVTDPAPDGDGDDVAEPGETISLSEQLRNPHATATATISGLLTTSTPDATVGQPNATWPDIGAGLAAANLPPFRVTIPANASCDSTVQLNLAMTTNVGGGFAIPLQVPIGRKASTDVPKVIPSASAGVDSTLTFAGAGAVDDLEVRITKLAHTYVGDLVVRLTNPAGTKTVTLMDGPGTGTYGASGDDLVDLVLDDDAATPIENIPATNPSGGYTGRYRPDQPLSVFDGDDRQGAWTLTVIDDYPADDSGTLYGWGVRPASGPCANRAPEAADDADSVATNQVLHGLSVLANDSDPDGDALTAIKETDPAHGTVALASDGTFTYTPQASFTGSDSFSYRARDSRTPPLSSAQPAIVRIAVGNRPPSAADDAYTVVSGAKLGASVLANDSDPNGDALSATLASGTAHGTVALAADGTFTYTPDAGFTGRDAFTYHASDGTTSSAVATATITVAAGPSAPAPPPAPAPSPPPPPAPAARAPAKLEVHRAGVRTGRLDVLADITAKATGSVAVSYRSSGTTTRFTVPIEDGTIRVARALPARQRHKHTGLVTLTYHGDAAVQADSLTLRAAGRKAGLVRRTSRIDGRGRLLVSGSISPRARGVVRIRFGYAMAGGNAAVVEFSAKIKRGAWSLTAALVPAAAKAGGQLSIQFTGYEPLGMRGEQLAKAVSPAG